MAWAHYVQIVCKYVNEIMNETKYMYISRTPSHIQIQNIIIIRSVMFYLLFDFIQMQKEAHWPKNCHKDFFM